MMILERYRKKINEKIEQTINEEKHPCVRSLLGTAVRNGQRFRPLLFLMTYKILGHEPDETSYELAAAIEMLHKASLIHDDLIDHDDYRRGKPAFHLQHGSEKAIIIGDLLVALASVRFARFAGENQIEHWLSQYHKLCYGELLDVISADYPVNQDFVEEMIYGKTASFLEFIFETAAIACQATKEKQKLLGRFGQEIGFISQYINDWNNWSGREVAVGREPGSDLAKGKINLIALYLQKEDKPEKVSEQLREVIERHSKKAHQILNELGPDNKYTKILRKILTEKYTGWYWAEKDE